MDKAATEEDRRSSTGVSVITRRQIAELKRLRQELLDQISEAGLDDYTRCLQDDLGDLESDIEIKVSEEAVPEGSVERGLMTEEEADRRREAALAEVDMESEIK